MSTASKTAELVKANRARLEAEREIADTNPSISTTFIEDDTDAQDTKEAKIAAAEDLAAVKVQARNGTLDGTIDVMAMGDVKGDGGDAKDYDDSDPAKALGVPVYEHGLAATKDGVEVYAGAPSVTGDRLSAQTIAEMEAGRAAMRGTASSRRAETMTASERSVAADHAAAEEAAAAKKAEEDAAEKKAAAKK